MELASRPMPESPESLDSTSRAAVRTCRFTSNLPEALRPASICSATPIVSRLSRLDCHGCDAVAAEA